MNTELKNQPREKSEKVATIRVTFAHNTIVRVILCGETVKYVAKDSSEAEWMKALVEYATRRGKVKQVKRRGYSRLWGPRTYVNDVYTATASLLKLLELVTQSRNWTRSPYARHIVSKALACLSTS